jgi:hypothetical protein
MAHPGRQTEAIAAPGPFASTGVRTLEKRPKYCHFVPLFGTPGAPPWREIPRLKSIRSRSLGHEMWEPGRREGVVA